MMPTQSSILWQIARKRSASVALCRPVSRMRVGPQLWAAAASFCLSVAISAAAAAVRSTVITSVSRDRADCAFPLSGLAKIRITSGTCLRRGRADRAFTPSGFAKIFCDDAGVPSCHWSRCACSQIHTFTDPSIVAVGMHCRFNACPRFHDLLTSRALKLCHERASDHWPHLVRPRGDGLFFSAHRRWDRAATKRSSASTFKHG
jgi:hypothetical protein